MHTLTKKLLELDKKMYEKEKKRAIKEGLKRKEQMQIQFDNMSKDDEFYEIYQKLLSDDAYFIPESDYESEFRVLPLMLKNNNKPDKN